MSIESRISVKAGETPLLQFGPILDANNSPVDLTGAKIVFAISDINKVTVLLRKDNGSIGGVTIPDQTTNRGIFNVQWALLDTDELSGEYYFEAGLFLNGISATCSFGPFAIDKSIVR